MWLYKHLSDPVCTGKIVFYWQKGFELDQKEVLADLEKSLREWTSTSLGRRSFLKAMPLLLASCASQNLNHRYNEGDNTGQRVSLSPSDEKRMAKQVLPSMQKQYPTLRDHEMQRYVSSLGNRIVSANGLHQNPYTYTFEVVETPQINAFALPAGPIFITAPLLAMCDTESELAGVIGHEIGHIKSRHTAERIYREEQTKGKAIAYLLGGGVLGGVLGYGLGKLICAPRDRNCIAKTTQLGAVAGAGGATLISKFGFMAHSREDELEADRVGFKTAVNAGFSKNHVGNFYEKLLEMESASGSGRKSANSFADALSTHPPSMQRVSQVQQMARDTRGLGRGIVSSSAFDRVRRRAVEITTS